VTRIEHQDEIASGAAQRPRASLTRTLLAVLWSFFGVRKSSDLDRDIKELKPLHVVVAGLVCAALFVGLLVALVQWVIRSGVAA
jgi:amino acid transporter